jgi:hypothetical protein
MSNGMHTGNIVVIFLLEKCTFYNAKNAKKLPTLFRRTFEAHSFIKRPIDSLIDRNVFE